MLEIVLSLGLPVLFVVFLTMLRCVSKGERADAHTVQETALDIAFLGTGTVGITIYDQKIRDALNPNAPLWAVLLFVMDFGVAILLVYLEKFFKAKTRTAAFWNVVIGSLPIMAVAALTALPKIMELWEKHQ